MFSSVHHFKCPLCNNRENFQAEMLKFGINIPDQDAAWEMENDAFNDHSHPSTFLQVIYGYQWLSLFPIPFDVLTASALDMANHIARVSRRVPAVVKKTTITPVVTGQNIVSTVMVIMPRLISHVQSGN